MREGKYINILEIMNKDEFQKKYLATAERYYMERASGNVKPARTKEILKFFFNLHTIASIGKVEKHLGPHLTEYSTMAPDPVFIEKHLREVWETYEKYLTRDIC